MHIQISNYSHSHGVRINEGVLYNMHAFFYMQEPVLLSSSSEGEPEGMQESMVPSDYIQQYLAESRQIRQEQDKVYMESLEIDKLKVGIIIYSIVHILTIVFPGSHNVKYSMV